jgi:hypothetical protein
MGRPPPLAAGDALPGVRLGLGEWFGGGGR